MIYSGKVTKAANIHTYSFLSSSYMQKQYIICNLPITVFDRTATMLLGFTRTRLLVIAQYMQFQLNSESCELLIV